MIDSKRLTVIKAISRLLSGITFWEGYQHDMSCAVFRGARIYGHNDPLPMLAIQEIFDMQQPAQFVGDAGRRYKHTLQLAVQGWTSAGASEEGYSDPAYLLMADVQKRLSTIMSDDHIDYMLGGLITKCEVSPGGVTSDDRQAGEPMFVVMVRIELSESLADPYQCP